MSGESSAQLVERLSHPNGWWRDTAQRLLVERQAVDAVPACASSARGESDLGRARSVDIRKDSVSSTGSIEPGCRPAMPDRVPRH
ncbi:MAG: hypothetical protein R3C56_19565 [Pirellulaceae bacterium]